MISRNKVRWAIAIMTIAILMQNILSTQALESLGRAPQAMAQNQPSQTDQSGPTCAEPAPSEAAKCRAIEAAILASTVRIEIQSWIMYVEGIGHTRLRGDGHGTVKDGRYLVTHNHYDPIPLALLDDKESAEAFTVTIHNAIGERLSQVNGEAMSVAFIGEETIMFDFGPGFFDVLGVASAEFLNWATASLQPGMEVAQVDWDLTQAHVNWTTIRMIFVGDGTAAIRLSNCVELGASGGGVYWNGTHIGNNWSRVAQCQADPATGLAPHTDVALNALP